jgi:hypothetical protein
MEDREMIDQEERRPLSTADLAGRGEDGQERPQDDGVRDLKHQPAEDDRAPRDHGSEVPSTTGEEKGQTDEGMDAGSMRQPLFPEERTEGFQSRWVEIQTRFVDQPRESVQAADALVAELMQQLADGFSRVRSGLEGQWDRGDQVSTEELRVALQRYRSFFERLLAA